MKNRNATDRTAPTALPRTATGRRPSGWRWTNVPIPEPHVVGLLAGLGLHLIEQRPLRAERSRGPSLGWVFVGLGSLIVAWTVRTAGTTDLERPTTLVTTGPYAFSRNPMYVAWTALYVGIALLSNSAWPWALLPAVLASTHDVVRSEERSLERTFGDRYVGYRRSVRRYV